MKFNRTWDLKVSKQMIYFYNTTKKNGNNYFWNFNLEKAVQLVKILSESYNIRVPKVVSNTKVLKELGKKYKTKVIPCKTIRDRNNVALSSRNFLLKKPNLVIAAKIYEKLVSIKKYIKNKKNIRIFLNFQKKELENNYKIKID